MLATRSLNLISDLNGVQAYIDILYHLAGSLEAVLGMILIPQIPHVCVINRELLQTKKRRKP